MVAPFVSPYAKWIHEIRMPSINNRCVSIYRQISVQTYGYDLQAKTYPNICTDYKLHNNNENKFPVFPERICSKWQNMM